MIPGLAWPKVAPKWDLVVSNCSFHQWPWLEYPRQWHLLPLAAALVPPKKKYFMVEKRDSTMGKVAELHKIDERLIDMHSSAVVAHARGYPKSDITEKILKKDRYLGSHDPLSLRDQIAFGTRTISPLTMAFMSFEPGNHAMISTSSALRPTSRGRIFVIQVQVNVGVGGGVGRCSGCGVHRSVVGHKVATLESVAAHGVPEESDSESLVRGSQ